MKKIVNIICLVLGLLTISCQDSYMPESPVTDWTWYTGNYPNTPFSLFQGEYLSFRDVSQNALSREWVIDESCQYLISSKDIATADDLTPYIDSSIGSVATTSDIYVLFQEGGEATVTLRNTFDQEVSFNGDQEGITVTQDAETGLWIAEKIFTFSVYGEADPAFAVYKVNNDSSEELLCEVAQGEEVDATGANWQTVFLEVGDSVKFVDLTTEGYPESRTWSIVLSDQDAQTYSDSVQVVAFENVGEFKGSTITTEHTIDQVSKSYSKIIPLIFNVSAPSVSTAKSNGETEDIDDKEENAV